MTEGVRIIDRAALVAGTGASGDREWLVANGLGGYASATLSGATVRRYHGLLIAALSAPAGRFVMLNHLAEHLVLADGREVVLGGEEPGEEKTADSLVEFRVDHGLPVWRHAVADTVIEKRVVMAHRQNIVYLSYRRLAGDAPVWLRLRPSVNFRPLESSVRELQGGAYRLTAEGDRYEISAGAGMPVLRLMVSGGSMPLTLDGGHRREVVYPEEGLRGHDALGPLWTPGFFAGRLEPGHTLTLVAAADPWDVVLALRPEDVSGYERDRRRRLVTQAHPAARVAPAAELVQAADAFVITPVGRVADVARAHAEGDAVRTVIAGYHWFTDWGRDTMISLEGLTLTTGRADEAKGILRTFAHHVRDGLIPNMFPEGQNDGLYHTADATLWFFHAVDRYLQATGDRDTMRRLLPTLKDIVDHHRLGTRFGIGVDPTDGLLRQGEEGYQLTWMDAKVDGWVVTPRRGKAVEINALWYNALRLLAGWLREDGRADEAAAVDRQADTAQASFNRRFWYEAGGYLHDVVDGADGDDSLCRPNQVLAISLRHPVLDPERWPAVLAVVRAKLLTPVGLRSLAPSHPDYKAKYFGDLRARDAAYHQGTVWGWLIGPMVDAWLKVYPDDRAGARKLLDGFWPHLSEAGIGTISEIFDAEPPFAARGCISQAWSVAEVLRCWVKTAQDPVESPPGPPA